MSTAYRATAFVLERRRARSEEMMQRLDPSILRHVRWGEKRPVAEVARAYNLLRELRLRTLQHAQTVALFRLKRCLCAENEGNYEIVQEPDKIHRDRKAADAILCCRETGHRLAVEASQILVRGDELEQQRVMIDILGGLGVRLNGKLAGTFHLMVPHRPRLSRKNFEAVLDEVSTELLLADASLPVNGWQKLSYGFASVKAASDGASIHLDVLQASADILRGKADPTRPIQLDQLFDPVLKEATLKFATEICETCLVVQFHANLTRPEELRNGLLPLKSKYPSVNRCYVFEHWQSEMLRIW